MNLVFLTLGCKPIRKEGKRQRLVMSTTSDPNLQDPTTFLSVRSREAAGMDYRFQILG